LRDLFAAGVGAAIDCAVELDRPGMMPRGLAVRAWASG
jgi:hypothetical protein